MYAENDLDIRNRDNVRNNGEVFTPTPIVDSMNDLVPLDAWKDKEFVFIEPTCGNGQFLTRIFEKRIANGLTIEEALNTSLRRMLLSLCCSSATSKRFRWTRH